MKIYIILHAGGISESYSRLKLELEKYYYVKILELNGRGIKKEFPFQEHLVEAAKQLSEELILDNNNKEEFILFGHSMGAWIAYEMYYYLQLQGHTPNKIIFSGNEPPRKVREDEKISHLNEQEFIYEIVKMGGTPKELFESPITSNFFLPILWADYKMLESYEPIRPSEKIKSSILVMCGQYDAEVLQLPKWEEYADCVCLIKIVQGNHFYHLSDVPNTIKNMVAFIEGTIVERGKNVGTGKKIYQ